MDLTISGTRVLPDSLSSVSGPQQVAQSPSSVSSNIEDSLANPLVTNISNTFLDGKKPFDFTKEGAYKELNSFVKKATDEEGKPYTLEQKTEALQAIMSKLHDTHGDALDCLLDDAGPRSPFSVYGTAGSSEDNLVRAAIEFVHSNSAKKNAYLNRKFGKNVVQMNRALVTPAKKFALGEQEERGIKMLFDYSPAKSALTPDTDFKGFYSAMGTAMGNRFLYIINKTDKAVKGVMAGIIALFTKGATLGPIGALSMAVALTAGFVVGTVGLAAAVTAALVDIVGGFVLGTIGKAFVLAFGGLVVLAVKYLFSPVWEYILQPTLRVLGAVALGAVATLAVAPCEAAIRGLGRVLRAAVSDQERMNNLEQGMKELQRANLQRDIRTEENGATNSDELLDVEDDRSLSTRFQEKARSFFGITMMAYELCGKLMHAPVGKLEQLPEGLKPGQVVNYSRLVRSIDSSDTRTLNRLQRLKDHLKPVVVPVVDPLSGVGTGEDEIMVYNPMFSSSSRSDIKRPTPLRMPPPASSVGTASSSSSVGGGRDSGEDVIGSGSPISPGSDAATGTDNHHA